jgi:hypothetical protein
MLETHLGREYKPTTHWTSDLRRMVGHAPYVYSDPDTSTFTFTDLNGTMKEFLVRHGWKKYACNEATVFHIEVCTTEEGLNSKFVLDPKQVLKVSFLFPKLHNIAVPSD